jgi:DNA-binding PadR family transcriptional regulator
VGNGTSIRITPAFFFLLLTLVEGERHGYAMAKEAEERSDGSISIGPGSLYWSLSRLADAGLIEESRAPEDDSREGRRRYYRLTGRGRTVLEEELETLSRVVSFARDKQVI